MSNTPGDSESLAESWVDVTNSGRVTPIAALPAMGLINGSPAASVGNGSGGPISAQLNDEYMRLLRDAQNEGKSNHSSSRVSLASSRRDSRCESPKSPAHTPKVPDAEEEGEEGDEEELKDIFINKDDGSKDWYLSIWDCCGRGKAKLSLRRAKCGDKGLFSRDVMFTMILSNVLSLIIGAGIGLWISKRPSNVISQVPLN